MLLANPWPNLLHAVLGQVTDLGAVLHMVGGTAASYMIFFLPGLLLINAAIVKHSASSRDLSSQAEVHPRLAALHANAPKPCPHDYTL